MNTRTQRDYTKFIKKKARIVAPCGFEPEAMSARLFDYQRDLVTWACRRGRAALFADTGLGKSGMQLAWADQVARKTGRPVIVLAPLAVAAQTVREAAAFGIDGVRQVREASEIGDARIVVTNYERLEKFDCSIFGGVVIDESSILKDYTSKTKQLVIDSFSATPYRLACTATPAPNDTTELGNHAEFLGICSRVEMLAEYFTHDGGETQTWRLKGHAKNAFWKWICSWAAVLRSPEDLGYDGSAHKLPALDHFEHIVTDDTGFARDRGLLFATDALTLDDQRKARRASLAKRVEVAAKLVAAEPDESWILWCELNDEADALTAAIEGAVNIQGSDDPDKKAERMLAFSDGKIRVLVTKPSIAGWGLNWQHCARVGFVGIGHSFEAYYQAIRRCWRFGQKRPVHAHIISSDVEGAVLANLKRKQSDALAMAASMSEHTRSYVQSSVRGSVRETNAYNPKKPISIPTWLVSDFEVQS